MNLRSKHISLAFMLCLLSVSLGACRAVAPERAAATASTAASDQVPAAVITLDPGSAQTEASPASPSVAAATQTPDSPAATPTETQASGANNLFDAAYFSLLVRDPENVAGLGLNEALALDNRQLTDVSPAYQQETYAIARSHLQELQAIDASSLPASEQISYAIFEWYLEDLVAEQDFIYHQFPVNQLFGTHANLVDLFISVHQIVTPEDALAYIARLNAVRTKSEQLIEWLNVQEDMGIVPPGFMIEHVLDQLGRYADPEPENHLLYTDFTGKLEDLDGLGSAERDRLEQEALQAIRANVLPGFGMLVDHFERQLASFEHNAGLWIHPRGEAAYRHWLRHHSTTDLTADEIHALGVAEVERITAEMNLLYEQLGIQGETMGEKIGQVAVSSGFISGNDAILDEFSRLIQEAPQVFDGYFAVWPEVPVEVVPFTSRTGPGAYYIQPALDGSRPGQFFVNIGGSAARFSMPTLAYHEAIPGHHHQIALQQQIPDLPAFRNGVTFTAYAEGWALYAEYLALEAGVYADNPHGNLGRLQGELFRAARLVVDTGLHASGWSRDNAVDYLITTVGMARGAALAEVERYIVWPGQATAYKLGMLKILELREQAMQVLGAEFDIVEFHRIILQNGSMPLEVLETVVEQWIAAQAE